MTSKKRFCSALLGGRVDRPPFTAGSNLTLELAETAGVKWPDCIIKAEEMAKFNIARVEAWGCDTIISNNDMPAEAWAFGGTLGGETETKFMTKTIDVGGGVTAEYPVAVSGDIIINLGSPSTNPSVFKSPCKDKNPKDVSVPDNLLEHDKHQELMKEIEIETEAYDDTVAVIRLISMPATLAGFIFGTERLCRVSKTDPDKFRDMLEMAADIDIEIALDSAAHGADAFYLCDPTATTDLFDPKDFGEYILPTYQRIAKKLSNWPTYVHICGTAGPLAPYIKHSGFDGWSFEYPGVPGGVPYVKSVLGDEMSTIGAVQTVATLMNGTPEDVKKESLWWLRQGIDVLMPACGTPAPATNANMRAMHEAVMEFMEETDNMSSTRWKVSEFMSGLHAGLKERGR
nr:MtsA [uncultured archaeon]